MKRGKENKEALVLEKVASREGGSEREKKKRIVRERKGTLGSAKWEKKLSRKKKTLAWEVVGKERKTVLKRKEPEKKKGVFLSNRMKKKDPLEVRKRQAFPKEKASGKKFKKKYYEGGGTRACTKKKMIISGKRKKPFFMQKKRKTASKKKRETWKDVLEKKAIGVTKTGGKGGETTNTKKKAIFPCKGGMHIAVALD